MQQLKHLLSILMLFSIFLSQSAFSTEKKLYVVNIASSLKTFGPGSLPNYKPQAEQRYYSIRLKYKNKIWNRLRLGFFQTKPEATRVLVEIRKKYPDAFLGLVPQKEIGLSSKYQIHRAVYPVEYLLVKTTDAIISTVASIDLPKQEKGSPARQPAQTDSTANAFYIISLKTSSDLKDFNQIINNPLIARHALYISDLEVDKRTWYQYRVGFFTSEKAAESILSGLNNTFPLARVIRISPEEKKIATAKIRAFTAVVKPEAQSRPKLAHPEKAHTVYKSLINKGSRALSDKQYNTAIKHFSVLLSYPENGYSKDAQELLGFAYELAGKISQARTEYETYISLYPESRGVIRIKQRLAGLITARKPAPGKLQDLKKKDIKPEWNIYGSLSQFYRRDTSSLDINTENESIIINTTDKRVNLSELDTILNLNAHRRSNDSDIRARFTGGYIYDFKADKESNTAPVNELYIDMLDLNRNINARLGRQTSNRGGVFGRFDGIDTGYQVSDWFKINLATGYLVNSVFHSADSENFFTSIKADFGTFLNAWDFSVYHMKQMEGEITGREAIGTEFRYFHPTRSLFGLIDHDILFDKTNTILLNGTWTLQNRTSFNATLDIRQSPLISAKSALQSQTFESIDEMLSSYSEQEIYQISEDRTAEVKTFITGISYPLSQQYMLNADFTTSKISATSASAGVEATPETDTEFYFNTQLVGTSVFKQDDTSITGLSYNDTTNSDTLTLRWNYRILATENLRINPRISVADRDNSNNTSQSIYGLAFKMDYRWGRQTSFEFELGGETSDKTLVSGEENNKIYFFNLGYHHNF